MDKKITFGVFSIFFVSFLLTPALAQTEVNLNLNPDFTQSETRTTLVPVGWYYGELDQAFGFPFFVDNPTPWNTSRADYTGSEVILIFDTTQFGFDKLPLVMQEPISIFDFNSTGNFDNVSYTANYKFDIIGGTDATFQACMVFTDSSNVTINFKCWGYNNASSSIPSDPIFANQVITDLGGGLFSFSTDLDFSAVNQNDLDRTAIVDIQLGRGGNHLGNITVFDSRFFKLIPPIPPTPLEITQDEVQAGLISVITLGIVLMIGFVVVMFVFLQLKGGGAETLVRFASIGALVIFIIMIILIIAFFGVV